jgi:excisionase family DNA binding protein
MRLRDAKCNTLLRMFVRFGAIVVKSGLLCKVVARRWDMTVRKDFLGVAEAEEMTGISRWTWRRWAYDGKIASVKMGKRLLIPTSELERLVTENLRPRIA